MEEKRGLRKINYGENTEKYLKIDREVIYMIQTGRITQSQRKAIDEIFWEKRYRENTTIINDLVELGVKHVDEFDETTLDSPLERKNSCLNFKPEIEKKIEELRSERKIKDTIVVIRTLIEIGLKHRDELPNRGTCSSA